MSSDDSNTDAIAAVPFSVEESVKLTEKQLRTIEDQVKQVPLTSELQALSVLQAQYNSDGESGSSGIKFLAGLQALQQVYSEIRTVRGDGNCFYRAVLYSLAEKLFSNQTESQRILNFVKKDSWENVKKVGYEEMTIEVFYDEVVDLFERVASGAIGPADLHKEMNQENATSDYCTWYLRVVTATHLKMDPDRFLPFIEQPGLDIEEFCKREVEPMGKECEQLQVLALAEAFGMQVQIEYLDGHDLVNGKPVQHNFGPDNAATKLTLLYRVGHYDILYPKASSC